jgi:Family of unknown function (DUF6165)
MRLEVPVGPGELIDKITILEIKAAQLSVPAQLANVHAELAALVAARTAAIDSSTELDELTAALKRVNQTLWRVEDQIRDCERAEDFGPQFIALARSVYRTNDERAAFKRRINELLDADIVEEKSYATY